MNSIFNFVLGVFPLVILVTILWVIWRAATSGLNAGLPKFGKGKKQKGGGDAVASWSQKQVSNAGKGIGRLAWKIISAPFR